MTTTVEWPPEEKVKVLGSLSRPELVGVGVAVATFTVGVASDRLLPAVVAAAAVLVWTLVPYQGRPLRHAVAGWLRWRLRHDRTWQAPADAATALPPFLAGVRVLLVDHPGGTPAAVVESTDGTCTVVFDAAAGSLAHQPEGAQRSWFDAWGEVLAGLCVEPGTALTAERVGWTDLHRAVGDVLRRQRPGCDDRGASAGSGPAVDDYARYCDELGATASAHRVLVWASVTRAGRLRVARATGLDGPPCDVVAHAAVVAGRQLAADLAGRGFTVGPLLDPAALGRVIADICDPFTPPPHQPTPRERFGLPERLAPGGLAVERHHVSVGRAVHRVFAVAWPRTPVERGWCALPLGAGGPKTTTMVLEAVPPSRADARRDVLTTRGESNNALASSARGRVRTVDRRKTAALHAAERAVASGHQELDGYGLIVVTARDVAELERRCTALRQRLREAGRAGVRELTGVHDHALAAALPIGLTVRAVAE